MNKVFQVLSRIRNLMIRLIDKPKEKALITMAYDAILRNVPLNLNPQP